MVLAGLAVASAQTDNAPSTTGAQAEVTTTVPGANGQERPHKEGFGVRGRGGLKVAAAAIGISEADLVTALRAGQSIAEVAKSKNVDPQKVIDALVAAGKAKLDAAAANLPGRVTEMVNHAGLPGPGPGGPGGRHGRGGPGVQLNVAAQAIGIAEVDLVTALRDGQSIAQVAQSKNVDPQKVIDAMVAHAKTKLAAKVTAGELTQAQADERIAKLTPRITEMVNHVGIGGGPDGPGGRRGHDPDGPDDDGPDDDGPPPAAATPPTTTAS